MSKILDELLREHRSIGNVLDVLESEIGYLAEFKGRRRADYRRVWSAIDYFTDFPDLVHHPKEDLLYERMREINPAIAAGLGDIPASHTAIALELRLLAAEVKAVMEDATRSRGMLIDLARGFIRHHRRHAELEEAVFFPAAEKMLDSHDWAELEYRMTARMDPLIGGEAGERFEALRRIIAEAVAGPAPTIGPTAVL